MEKAEILRKIDEIARKNGSILSFRRFCPDLNLPLLAEESDVPQDEQSEAKYYSWLVRTGIWRALTEDPGFLDCIAKHASNGKKTKVKAEDIKADAAKEVDPIRGCFKKLLE